MADRITTILVTLIGLCVLVVVAGAVTLTALAATGDAGAADGCRSEKPSDSGEPELRGVNNDAALSEAWQTKWNALNQQLTSGQSASASFTESETTSRAARYLESKDAPIDNLVICFHDGDAEASGTIDLPILGDIPGVGSAFDSNVLVRGTIDMSGANPKIVITDIEAGNLPGDAAERLKGRVEDIVNDRLDELVFKHNYTPEFSEGSATINGTP